MNTLEGTRWVVTGAAGIVGSGLRRALRAHGVSLVSTDVRHVDPVDGTHDRTVRADLAALEGLFEHADGVIHLGGLSDEADFHALAEVNIVGTYHVLEAARRAGVGRVVCASSNRVTGMYPTTAHVDPTMPARPDGFYGVSKVAGEALCRLYADKFGLSTMSVRIGSYEEEPSSPRERSTWLSHPDAVRAFIAAMTTEQHTATFYAVSANTDGWWDLAAGRDIGYAPQDDAATWSVPGEPDEPQGGPYAAPSYSLDRMES
jgi:uronate dehydrogenase